MKDTIPYKHNHRAALKRIHGDLLDADRQLSWACTIDMDVTELKQYLLKTGEFLDKVRTGMNQLFMEINRVD